MRDWSAVTEDWAAFGRGYTVSVETSTCARCRQETRCLVVDTSDGEYLTVNLCAACLVALGGEVATYQDGDPLPARPARGDPFDTDPEEAL